MKATVAIVSPLAMPGRKSFLAASSPLCSNVLAASTTVEKNGAHSSDRPISSSTMPSSMNVKPEPPNSSGIESPCRPICSAICRQTVSS